MSNTETKPEEVICEPGLRAGDVLLEARNVPLGGVKGVSVNRTLPHKNLPTIGAFCFVDQFGPTQQPGQILPHPHTGLQTVTWLFDGMIHHRDSAGSDIMVRPGQLNLMTAGTGIAHSEYDQEDSQFGFQLWTALPDSDRGTTPHFEQHSDLPKFSTGSLEAQVFIGSLHGFSSPAKTYTPMVAADLNIQPGSAVIELDPNFEHGLVFARGAARIEGQEVPSGPLMFLAKGRERVLIEVDEPTRGILIGGEPFTEPIVMWWNFIGRTHDEIVEFRELWENQDQRFGHVVGHGDEHIPAPPMPSVSLKARRRRTF